MKEWKRIAEARHREEMSLSKHTLGLGIFAFTTLAGMLAYWLAQ